MATLQEQLDEAQLVYHNWCIGKTTRRYRDSNGEEVEYTAEGLRNLSAYIADLKRQLGLTPCLGPMRPMFK